VLDADTMARILMGLMTLIISLSVHEWAHAATAFWLGDDTGAREGRLTLNPVSHIDPIGSLILPGFMLLQGPFLLGWARPVPFNPLNFTRKYRMKTSTMLTAAAGPASNLVLAVVSAFGITVAGWFGVELLASEPGSTQRAVAELLFMLVQLNIVLVILNLIPVPPLDGHKVAMGLLPDHLARRYDRFLTDNKDFVLIGLLAVLFLGGEYLFAPVAPIMSAIFWMTGVG